MLTEEVMQKMTVLEGTRHTLKVDIDRSALQLYTGTISGSKGMNRIDTFYLNADEIRTLRRRLEEMEPE